MGEALRISGPQNLPPFKGIAPPHRCLIPKGDVWCLNVVFHLLAELQGLGGPVTQASLLKMLQSQGFQSMPPAGGPIPPVGVLVKP